MMMVSTFMCHQLVEASAPQVPVTAKFKRCDPIRSVPRAGATLSAVSSATTATTLEPLSYYLRVALAGGVAGATGSAVLFPIDSAKTLRQTSPETYSSVRDALTKMLQSQNRLSRLYKGILPAALGAIPSSALYFGAYESCKVTLERLLFPNNDKSKSKFRRRLAVHCLAAASGNILSSSVFVPKEVIKQQLQFHAQQQSSAVSAEATHTIMSIIKEKGITGLYSGYGATLMRNIPSAMIRFVLYEELKRKFAYNDHSQPANTWGTFCAGALAGSTASFIMTPMDVLKSRQATGTCPVGVKNCMRHIVKSVGVKGLYAGAGSRMLWSGAFSAIGFGTFEVVKGYLGVKEPVDQDRRNSIQQRRRLN
jgi:solute carrier family 25 (mitochondrial S-adenosylmethionine transporter), member 26